MSDWEKLLEQFAAMSESAQRIFLGSDYPDDEAEPDDDNVRYFITPKGLERLRREAILEARRGPVAVPPWRVEGEG